MLLFRKIKKLFNNPKLFFVDFLKKRFNKKTLEYVPVKANKKILIYAPINNSGLYKHLTDICEILNKYDLSYFISWHQKPKIESYLKRFWINYEYAKTINPSLIINFERYNNEHKYNNNIFYINLDWLSKKDFLFSKIYADTIIYPNKYKLDLLKKVFFYKNFIQLNFLGLENGVGDEIKNENKIILKNNIDDKKIKVLYFAKELSNHRSNFEYVYSAFHQYKKKNIFLTVKTNDSNINDNNPNINFINKNLSDDELTQLYKSHDIVLIPNSCEGNGLLIFESLEMGCVPVVINGYPMKTYVDCKYAYLLPYLRFKRKNYAKYYEINSSIILDFFNNINYQDVLNKKIFIKQNRQTIFKERNKEIFNNKWKGILDYYDLIEENFDFKNKIRISSSKERDKILKKGKYIIDIFITSYNRFTFFKQCIESLDKAINKSKYQFRIHVFLDNLKDNNYYELIKKYKYNYYIYNNRLGLPYILYEIKSILKNYSERLTHKSKFFCYLQDDCLINDNINYFDDMIDITYNSVSKFNLNFLTGFSNAIHPGYEDFETINGKKCRLSRSIDGKNIFGFTNTIINIPLFSFFNTKFRRQGNPGPGIGSNFDLWLWRDNPVSKNKINIIYKNAISIQKESQEVKFSTWKNSENDDEIKKRLQTNKIYK